MNIRLFFFFETNVAYHTRTYANIHIRAPNWSYANIRNYGMDSLLRHIGMPVSTLFIEIFPVIEPMSEQVMMDVRADVSLENDNLL